MITNEVVSIFQSFDDYVTSVAMYIFILVYILLIPTEVHMSMYI